MNLVVFILTKNPDNTVKTNWTRPTIIVAYFAGIELPAASNMLTVLYTIALIPENCWKNIILMDIPNGFKMLLFNKSCSLILCCCCWFLSWFSLIRSNSTSIFVFLIIHFENKKNYFSSSKCFNYYFPRRRWRDSLAFVSWLCASNQIGVSGINVIPMNRTSGNEARIQAKMYHSVNAPII